LEEGCLLGPLDERMPEKHFGRWSLKEALGGDESRQNPRKVRLGKQQHSSSRVTLDLLRSKTTSAGHSHVIVIARVLVLVTAVVLPGLVALNELLEVRCALCLLDESVAQKFFGLRTLRSSLKEGSEINVIITVDK
jgi:hypothetical protein